MDVRTQSGFDFCTAQMHQLCMVIAGEGHDIEAKKIHWGGPDHSKHHAFVIGPFEESVRPAVTEHIVHSAFAEHFQVLSYDKNLFE